MTKIHGKSTVVVLIFAFALSVGVAPVTGEADVRYGCLRAIRFKPRHKNKSRLDLIQRVASRETNFLKFAVDRYGEEGVEIYRALKKSGENFEQLVADPGICVRYLEFVKFLKGKKFGSPWEAREAFSKSLGTETFYRGLAVYGWRISDIRDVYGLESTAIRTGYFDESTRGNLSEFLKAKIEGGARVWADPFMSVTKYPDVAAAVAMATAFYSFGVQRIVVFKLEIPVLDIIDHSKHTRSFGVSILFRGKYNRYVKSRELESFVFGKIDPDEVVSSEVISYFDVKPPF